MPGTVATAMPRRVHTWCVHRCRRGHCGYAQGALGRVLRGCGRAAELEPCGDHRLHILNRSAQLRRACFLDKLVHLVGGRAADGWVWSCSDISSVPLLARRRRSKAGLAFLVYKFLFCVTEFTGVFVQWPLNH